MNRRPVIDSDDESEDDDMEDEEGDEDDKGGGVEVERPLDISDDPDDEEEMAELRRKVLQSKPFANPTDTGQKPQPEKIARPERLPLSRTLSRFR
jgi:pre-rRNA-processing protein TSR3